MITITECEKCGHDHADIEPFYCMRCVRELNQQINDLTNELARYKANIERWALADDQDQEYEHHFVMQISSPEGEYS